MQQVQRQQLHLFWLYISTYLQRMWWDLHCYQLQNIEFKQSIDWKKMTLNFDLTDINIEILLISAHEDRRSFFSAQRLFKRKRMINTTSRTFWSYICSNAAVYHWTWSKNWILRSRSTDFERESSFDKRSFKYSSSQFDAASSLWSTNQDSSCFSSLYILIIKVSIEEKWSLTLNTSSIVFKRKISQLLHFQELRINWIFHLWLSNHRFM